MAQFNSIRPITQRLNTTSVEDLPRCVGSLAASILSCFALLQNADLQKSETSVQVHKLTTRVSSLVQDKTQEGRFVGIILIKALAEAIGPHSLGSLAPTWVRGLLSCLSKQDPPQVKKLAIIALSRIFLLTKGNQAMVREVTTPSLPAFLTTSLSLIKPTTTSKNGTEREILSPLLQPVLECWAQLMRAFPTTFRPFAASIRAICLKLVGQSTATHQTKAIATQVFVALHYCAPKDSSAIEWNQSIKLVIEGIHQTADLIFRSLVEEWSLVIPRQVLSVTKKRAAAQVQLNEVDAVGMEQWSGLSSGVSRVIDLLRLLHAMLIGSHAQGVRVPMTEVLDLTGRLSAVICPTPSYALRENKDFGRDEREELYASLPLMHSTMIELYHHLASILGSALLPVSRSVLLQLWNVLDAEYSDDQVRMTAYMALLVMLQKNAVLLQSTDSEQLSTFVRRLCVDLRSGSLEHRDLHVGSIGSQNRTLTLVPQPAAKHTQSPSQPRSPLMEAAWLLLPVVLSYIPSSLLALSARTDIDKTAILLGHEEALLASIMNPPATRKGARSAPSILPFLARTATDALSYESLVRPRMPVIRDIPENTSAEDSSEEPQVLDQSNIETTDTDLAVDRSVTVQMKYSEPTPSDSNVNAVRKRDVTAVDEVETSSFLEPAKRVRLDATDKPVDAGSNIHFNGRRHIADSTTPTSMNDERNPLLFKAAGATSQALIEPVTDQPEQLEVVTLPQKDKVQSFVNVNDDSDDSEIPQIDTALSSDEDEDDDDEEDMDE